MASPVAYDHEPNADVYVIHECDHKPYVTHGTVLRVRINVLVTGTEILYDIRLAGNAGTVAFEGTDVFLDKTSAAAEYENRV